MPSLEETQAPNGINGASHNLSYTNGTNGTTSHTNGTSPQTNGSSHTNGTTPHTNGTTNGTTPHTNGTAHIPDASIPIAICGMALRLPGGLSSPQEFWDFLIAKGDARSRVPESRYNISAYYNPEKGPGDIGTEHGYFLDESVKLGAFDSSRFSLSRTELEFADPQQRRLLEVVQEAFDDAGDISYRGKPIGCYVGNMGEDWAEISIRDPLSHGANRIDGYNDWMLGNRISYEFGLQGPSMTIRTACSSAFIGLSEACAAMQRGICDGAIVAGSTLILAPTATQMMTEKGILGPDGSCKTFSADANGYARGEAITAIFVKPLDAAIRDGNPIRGVIRAAVANSDGKTQGITQPNPIAHEAAIRKAYELADIKDFSKTAFFECHGTGTAIGDPLETGAVARVFGGNSNKIHITSVKPNIGHTEGASGVVSLIKAVMALENKTIPPNIKFSTPNPKIAWDKLMVPTEPTPFPADKHERVSVNSFGLGGANAHVVVDSAASFNIPKRVRGVKNEDAPQVLLLSAASATSLKKMIKEYDEWLTTYDLSEKYDDLAYTLANRREHLPHRAYKVVGGKTNATSAGKKIAGHSKNLVMVFTGQGAQWPQMGKELLLRDDLDFRSTMETLDDYLQGLPDNPPSWSIVKELQKSSKTSQVGKAHLSQPLCTAVQIGLVKMLSKIGVEPTAVVGHSSGELAAAYAAGALTEKEAIIGAYQRGQAAQLAKKGAMAAVAMPWAQVEKYLTPRCVVACENSPESVTLSGDIDEVQAVIERISQENPDTSAKLLRVEKAYHSSHMREIGDDYYALIKPHLEGKSAVKPFFSSVTGSGAEGPEKRILDAKYWQQNLESPVLFKTAVLGVLKHVENPAFLEIGPHGALAGPARQIFASASASPPYMSVMARNEDCVESFLKAAGQLFEINIPLDFEALTPSGTTLPGLPRYPWNHEGEELWRESRMSKEWRFPQFGKHPLLGRRQLECTDLEPSFRSLINMNDISWLRDHKIQNSTVFPAAGYLAMAGEAIRQLSGVNDGYKLQNVVISQALLLQDNTDIEVVTNLRHQNPDFHDVGSWWEFTISSYNAQSASWQKHCVGQVAPNQSSPAQAEHAQPLPRKMGREKTFDVLARAGMQYGPKFQRLNEISTGTIERKAVCSLTPDVNGDEKYYHVHPTVIDAALQAGLLAPTYGKIDPTNCAAMPTFLGQVSVFRATSNSLSVTAATEVDASSGDITGNFQCISGDKVVLDIPEAGFSSLKWDETSSKHHFPITGRMEWKPLLDFLKPASLIKAPYTRAQFEPLLREYSDLFIILSQRKIDASTNFAPSLAIKHFVPWVGRQIAGLPKDHPGHSMTDEEIVGRAYEITTQTADSPVAVVTACLLELGAVIPDLLTGATTIEKVLATDDLMARFFLMGNKMDRSAFLRSLAHSKPNLRILEIGGSTNGTTDSVLGVLNPPNGKPAFSRYMYSDVRPMTLCGPLADAKVKYAGVPNMDFRVLDVRNDPYEQGFDETDQYDLIMANNIVQETTSLEHSLKHIRKLLAPGGRFLLQELCVESKWVNCIWGFLDDWWFSAEDNRPDEPYMQPSEWSVHLEKAGMRLQDTMFDAEKPDQWNAVMVVTPQPVENKLATKAVTILSNDDVAVAGTLVKSLTDRGYKVDQCKLGEGLPKNQDIISLLDEKAPFFENTTEEQFKAFQQLLANLSESALLWITRPSQMHCSDPRYAQIIGMSRSVRSEEELHFGTLEVESLEASLEKVVDVFAYFQQRETHDDLLLPNYEFAISEGVVHVPRILPFTFDKETVSSSRRDVQVTLDVDTAGSTGLSHLKWTAQEKKALSGNQIEVEVFAAGLSSEDVSKVLGLTKRTTLGLGVEASGIVSRVGPEVKGLSVGDRVLCLGNGSAASYVITTEALAERIPESLSFEEAAVLPASYVTAKAALQNVGDLKSGQSILIHSAAGGVGLAALHVAQSLKAEVYATADNDKKIETLVSKYGVPRDHIFGSRSTDFAEQLLAQTDGKGVDYVLNTLSGDLLQATLTCVAPFGKVVTIGEGDLMEAGQYGANFLSEGRSYATISVETLITKGQRLVKGLLGSLVMESFFGYTAPQVTFEAQNAEDALKHVQEGNHVGKVVLRLRDSEGNLQVGTGVTRVLNEIKTDSAASYLLAGGLGGIATVIAKHLVENGARRLVCLSRNPGTKDTPTIRELESMGCEVVLVKGNLINKDDVFRAVKEATPLKGVIHAPMLVRDGSFKNMTLENWNMVAGPKVQGAWHLHDATKDMDLDFFVFFSSLSGLNGQPGQANYAAANTYLDSFAQFRNSLGLAASSIDIGAVADMGYAARDDALLQRLMINGYSGIVEREMIEAFSASVSYPVDDFKTKSETFSHKNTFAIGYSSITSPSNPESRAWWKRDIRMAMWHNISESKKEENSEADKGISALLGKVKADPSILHTPETVSFLALEIGKQLMNLLLRSDDDLDVSLSLTELGLDSLVGIELRTWWRSTFNADVSVLQLLGLGTLEGLAKQAISQLAATYGGDDAA